MLRPAQKKLAMPYTLITKKGTTMKFFVLGLAKIYQSIEGGKIVKTG